MHVHVGRAVVDEFDEVDDADCVGEGVGDC